VAVAVAVLLQMVEPAVVAVALAVSELEQH
jgi:hypothetical protein